MKRLKIIIKEEAIADLEEIWLFTLEKWSVEQADKYHTLLYKKIELLSLKPKSGKEKGYLRPGYYSAKVKSHIIFYKFSATELQVIRILHDKMDIPNKI